MYILAASSQGQPKPTIAGRAFRGARQAVRRLALAHPGLARRVESSDALALSNRSLLRLQDPTATDFLGGIPGLSQLVVHPFRVDPSGLRDLIIVGWRGAGNGQGEKNWMAASTLKKTAFPNAEVAWVRNEDEFVDLINRAPVDHLLIISHGTSNGPILSKDFQFTIHTLRRLKRGQIKEANIMACDVGNDVKGTPFAQNLADYFDISVLAFGHGGIYRNKAVGGDLMEDVPLDYKGSMYLVPQREGIEGERLFRPGVSPVEVGPGVRMIPLPEYPTHAPPYSGSEY